MAQPATVDDVKAKVETLARRNPAYAELCTFLGGLLLQSMQDRKPAGPVRLDLEAADRDLIQGRSLVDWSRVELDWELAGKRLKDLAAYLEDRPGMDGAAAALGEIHRSPNGRGKKLFRALLASDYQQIEEYGGQEGIAPQVLALLLRLALRPDLTAAARSLADRVDFTDWSFGHCPVCGGAPGLAEISGEGGARTLHCSVCETAWPYPRLRCPFCESDDFKAMTFLKPKQESWCQVEVCGRCGQYLKTLDLREMAGPIIVPLDDAATWHLDLVAQEHLSA